MYVTWIFVNPNTTLTLAFPPPFEPLWSKVTSHTLASTPPQATIISRDTHLYKGNLCIDHIIINTNHHYQ